MDFLELATKRFSARKFKPDNVPDDLVNKILEAAKVAPTARNNQPIKIYAISSQDAKDKIKKCTDCHFDAPLIMVVCYDNTQCSIRSFDKKPSGEIDASIVTTHIILEAYSLGIGTTWVMNFDPAMFVKEFNIPNNIIPVAFVPMGYPADDCIPSPRHTTYKNINDIVEKL